MSQTSLLRPHTPPSQPRPSSTKSGKQTFGKALKHALTRRKRSGSLRNGNDDADFDGMSERSVSIGPESFLSNEPSIAPDQRLSGEVIPGNNKPSPQRGRSPSRRVVTQPPKASPPRRRSQSLSRPDIATPIVLSSPLPRSTETFPASQLPSSHSTESKPNLSLDTSRLVPAMSITPATPINPPSLPSTPDNTTKGILTHQRSASRLNHNTISVKEEKPVTTSGSVGGAVWGSLLNAANKVTDTISSLTTPNNLGTPQIGRSVSAAPLADATANSLVRPRSQTMPSCLANPLSAEAETEDHVEEPKQMAIDTLGQGELSLRELGFESDTPHLARSSGEFSVPGLDEDGQEQNGPAMKPLKSSTADLAIPVEHKSLDNVSRSRRSLTVPARGTETASDLDRRLTAVGVQKPRRLSSLSKKGSVHRNESVASRASSEAIAADDVSRRARKRSSLVTDTGLDSPRLRATGTPEASEDRENEDGLYIHGKDGKRRRVPITGFAVQSGKRNRDFHALFKSVEESDYLIEDYSCALSKEILVQGRMYVSEHYICFNSNIFGWLIIAFTEVVSIEKRSTAVLFPNGIQITTLHAKYVFASFVGRDGTYDLLTSIWRLSHPDSRSPDDPYDSESVSPSSGSFSDEEDGSISDEDDNLSVRSAVSEDEVDEDNAVPKAISSTPISEKQKEDAEASSSQEQTGPESHARTECDCGKDGHYDKVGCDEIVKAPLGKVWNCAFGENKDFIMSFLRDNQKLQDITVGDWKSGDNVKGERQISYIKPLNNSMGPKQTKCNITEQVQHQDFNAFCVALTTTVTPDVPSGSSFQVMTKYCLTWAGGSTTRVLITYNIEWSKSSWIKGAIEKGVSEGQTSSAKDLVAELRRKLAGASVGAKRKPVGKKKGGKRKLEESRDEQPVAEQRPERRGLIGTAQQMVGSLDDVFGPLIKPLFSSTGLVSFLLILVFSALIRMERTMANLSLTPQSVVPSNILRNEAHSPVDQEWLWDWIDARIGSVKKESRAGQVMWGNLMSAGGTEGELAEVEEAIRITEGKLVALKAAVEKRKEGSA